MNLYFPALLFDENHRQDWFELIKSRERLQRKGDELDKRIQERLTWVENPDDATLWILPMDWRYYAERGLMKQALAFCKKAASQQKQVWSFNGGDYGMEIKPGSNVRIFRMSYNRSAQKSTDRIMPFFLSDPVEHVMKSDDTEMLFSERETTTPIVGFCGMAPHGQKIYIREWLLAAVQNTKSAFGKIKRIYQPYVSTSILRYKALKVFAQSESFQTDYIIHAKHRAGAKTIEERKESTEAYYANMLRSQLVLCVRGAGNFSVRFYETLAMGRIPVFIDTDSPLPDISPKDWNDFIIWVDRKDLKRAPQIAKAWLSNRELREQQRKNRQLWVEHFRGDNYWMRELENVQNSFGKNT